MARPQSSVSAFFLLLLLACGAPCFGSFLDPGSFSYSPPSFSYSLASFEAWDGRPRQHESR